MRRRLEDDAVLQAIAGHSSTDVRLEIAVTYDVDAEGEATVIELASHLDHQQRILLRDQAGDEEQVDSVLDEARLRAYPCGTEEICVDSRGYHYDSLARYPVVDNRIADMGA